MIRQAGEGDVHELCRMERAASGTALTHIFAGIDFPHDDVRARWQLVLDDASAQVIVDEVDGQLVGYAAYGDGWLRHFGVVPEHWGSGRAQALYAAVVERATAAGSPTTYLWVLVDNHRARAFYRRLGWHDTDVREPETFPPYPIKTQMTRPLGGDQRSTHAWT
ncbi:MAG: GNAT family N-acetyltransferase [Nocardioidaceae bacterium]|nr:GNAT family N-acetyltransferase [Nocardioidaceae bacterium]